MTVCSSKGCKKKGTRNGRKLKNGKFLKLCEACYDLLYVDEIGIPLTRWKLLKKFRPFIRKGFTTLEIKAALVEKHLATNSHSRPYYIHRKNYCENIDSRLGFPCTYTKPELPELEHMGPGSWLSVDHIDGDHTNNAEENCQTLCHTCHHVKSILDGNKSKTDWELNDDTHQELIDLYDKIVIWNEMDPEDRPASVDKIKLNYQRVPPS